MINPDEIGFTNDENKIICTRALATCIGILIYDESNKKAALGHFYSNKTGSSIQEEANDIFVNLMANLDINNMLKKNLKYMILPGSDAYYENNIKIYEVCDELERKFKLYPNFISFAQDELKEDSIKENVETKSLEFAFDSSSGSFVSNEIFKNDMNFDHYELYPNNNTKSL